MYSFLILNSGKYVYHTNADGSVWKGDLEAAKTQLAALAQKYALGSVSVVRNCTITPEFGIAEVEE